MTDLNPITGRGVSSAEHIQHSTSELYKMDILFYNSYLSVRRTYIWKLIYFCIALVIVTVFLPIDVRVIKTDQIEIIVFMGVAIGVVTLNILICICTLLSLFSNKEENNRFLLNISAVLNHSVPNEPIPNSNISDIHKCVSSNMYNYTNNSLNDSEGLTPEIRAKYEEINKHAIHSEMIAENPCTECLEKNARFCIFAIIIYGIVVLASKNPNTAEIAVLSVFLVYISLCVIIIFVVLLAIALSPLLICVLCVCCCVRGGNFMMETKMPEEMAATLPMIEKSEGSCTICLQNFNVNEMVIVLPCSAKHMFHSGCINNWARFGTPTCPICRKPIE